MDRVEQTARRLNMSVEHIFRDATAAKVKTNKIEAFKYRYARWLKYGEIPSYIQDYCLKLEGGTDAATSPVQPQ